MAKIHEHLGVTADPVRVDQARLDLATQESGSDGFRPDRARLPVWLPTSPRPQGMIVRAGSLERGDRALINGGTFQQIAWIVTDETPDRCVIGTEAGLSVRLWTHQLIVAIR
jgi:hypothetical protein